MRDLKEFIAWAKQNPGKLNHASQGNGSVSHIGIEMTHVPYKGSGQSHQGRPDQIRLNQPILNMGISQLQAQLALHARVHHAT